MKLKSLWPVGASRLVRFFSSFIGSWRHGNTRQIQGSEEGSRDAPDEVSPTWKTFGSSAPPCPGLPALLGQVNPEEIPPSCCKREMAPEAESPCEANPEWPTDMLHTTIFGSPADFQMLLEVEASQGLSGRRELRMRQRVIGREIYSQALHGVRWSLPITLQGIRQRLAGGRSHS